MINYDIELTVDAEYTYSLPAMKQYDSQSRTIKARIKNREGSYITDTNAYRYNFRAMKPDGKPVYVRANWEGGKVVYTLDRQVLAAAGTVLCDFEVLKGDTVVLSTQLIQIEVEPVALTPDALQSDSLVNAVGGIGAEASAIVAMINKLSEHAKRTADSADKALKDQESALNAIKTAESSRVSAESTRVTEENKRKQSETDRSRAETERQNAETARVSAEAARVKAEQGRVTAESERVKAETARAGEESKRIQAEQARAKAEGERARAENDRITNSILWMGDEQKRNDAEKARASAESARETKEQERQRAETARVSAEGGRVTAEQGRVSAEGKRTQRADEDHTRLQALIDTLGKMESGALANDVAQIKTKLQTYASRLDTLTAGELDTTLDTIKELADAIKRGGADVKALTTTVSGKADKTELATEAKRVTDLLRAEAQQAKNETTSALAGKVDKSQMSVVQDDIKRLSAKPSTPIDDDLAKKRNDATISNAKAAEMWERISNTRTNSEFYWGLFSMARTLTGGDVSSTQPDHRKAWCIVDAREVIADLRKQIAEKPNTPVVDSLTSKSTTSALSANQGSLLSEMLESTKKQVNYYINSLGGKIDSKADKTDLTNLTKRVDALEAKKPYEIVANAEASKSKPGVLCLVKEV